MAQHGTTHVKLKVVVVGDSGVGKTALGARFTQNTFIDNYTLTVGGSFCTRALYIANKKVIFQIWDTAGTERYKSIVPFYLRDADVALVTYDICEKNSFKNTQQWLRLLQESAPETITCVLVGNKTDLTEKRQVTTQEGMAFADEHGFHFNETSAKTGQNVPQLFLDIGSRFVNGTSRRVRRNTSVVTVTNSDIPKRKNECCD